MGTEISKLNPTVISVVIIDGKIVIFLLLNSYSPKSRCGLENKCGAPFANINPITSKSVIPAKTPAQIAAPAPIFGVFILYLNPDILSLHFVQKVVFFVFSFLLKILENILLPSTAPLIAFFEMAPNTRFTISTNTSKITPVATRAPC